MKKKAKLISKLKKPLDKYLDRVYNIRREVDLEDLLAHSLNTDNSILVHNQITVLSEQLCKVPSAMGKAEEDFPSMLIAGGSIRDRIFGLGPKDFDVFVDISDYDKDEAEDLLLLICEEIRQQQDDPDEYIHPKRLGEEEEPYLETDDDTEDPCIVYEIYPNTDFLLDDRIINQIKPIQVIGYRNKDIKNNPFKFLDTFDYSLVKAFFDPFKKEYGVHKDFHKSLDNKIVEYSGSKPKARVVNFKWKWERTFGRDTFFPFDLQRKQTQEEIEAARRWLT